MCTGLHWSIEEINLEPVLVMLLILLSMLTVEGLLLFA